MGDFPPKVGQVQAIVNTVDLKEQMLEVAVRNVWFHPLVWDGGTFQSIKILVTISKQMLLQSDDSKKIYPSLPLVRDWGTSQSIIIQVTSK